MWGQTRGNGRGEDRKKRVMGNINKAAKKNSKRKKVRINFIAFS